MKINGNGYRFRFILFFIKNINKQMLGKNFNKQIKIRFINQTVEKKLFIDMAYISDILEILVILTEYNDIHLKEFYICSITSLVLTIMDLYRNYNFLPEFYKMLMIIKTLIILFILPFTFILTSFYIEPMLNIYFTICIGMISIKVLTNILIIIFEHFMKIY